MTTTSEVEKRLSSGKSEILVSGRVVEISAKGTALPHHKSFSLKTDMSIIGPIVLPAEGELVKKEVHLDKEIDEEKFSRIKPGDYLEIRGVLIGAPHGESLDKYGMVIFPIHMMKMAPKLETLSESTTKH